jgi:hypothetical protein
MSLEISFQGKYKNSLRYAGNPIVLHEFLHGRPLIFKMSPQTAAKTARSTGSSHPDRVRMLVLETDYTFKSVSERKGGTVGKILHDVFAEAGRQHEPPR